MKKNFLLFFLFSISHIHCTFEARAIGVVRFLYQLFDTNHKNGINTETVIHTTPIKAIMKNLITTTLSNFVLLKK